MMAVLLNMVERTMVLMIRQFGVIYAFIYTLLHYCPPKGLHSMGHFLFHGS